MAKMIDEIRDKLLEEVVSMTELENIMAENGLFLMETEGEDAENIVKFTNSTSQVWVEYVRDDGLDMLITRVSRINRTSSDKTKGDPFHSYDDLMLFQNYFYNKRMYRHWLAGWVMVSEGRRIGDTFSLKWKDFFYANGNYKRRLEQLREEKTGKIVAPIINSLCKYYMDEYLKITGIDPTQHLEDKIFSCQPSAFRKVFKEAYEAFHIDYPLTPHGYRKYYGNTLYKLHPQDANNIKIIQFMFGHSSEDVTKMYIGEIDEKIDAYNKDLSDYFLAKKDGVETEISNSPIVSLKAEDFRMLLGQLWEMGAKGRDKFESINDIIGGAEQLVV